MCIFEDPAGAGPSLYIILVAAVAFRAARAKAENLHFMLGGLDGDEIDEHLLAAVERC